MLSLAWKICCTTSKELKNSRSILISAKLNSTFLLAWSYLECSRCFRIYLVKMLAINHLNVSPPTPHPTSVQGTNMDIFGSYVFFFFLQHYDLKKLRMLRFGMIQFVCFLFGMQVRVIFWVIFFSTSLQGLF